MNCAKNRLAAIKHATREKTKQEKHAEMANSVMQKEVDEIGVDAGFFGVETPVKSFSGQFFCWHYVREHFGFDEHI